MKKLLQGVRWIGDHKKMVFIAICAIGGIVYYFNRTVPAPVLETAIVVRDTLVQEVAVTGKVTPNTTIDLAFERSGRVVSVGAEVGDRVGKGDVLIRLDSGELNASRNQAIANLAAEQARLDELVRGTRPEELRLAETEVENNRVGLLDAKQSIGDGLEDAYTKADDAIRSRTDHLFRDPSTSNPQLEVPMADDRLQLNLIEQRKQIEVELSDWRTKLDLSSTPDDKVNAVPDAKRRLSLVKRYLEDLLSAINTIPVSTMTSQATLDSWKLDISTARASMSVAISNLQAGDDKLRLARSALLVSERQLDVKKAGSSLESVAAAQARVDSARASVDSIDSQLSKVVLRAPIAGVVTELLVKRGEIVTPNKTVISLQSSGSYKLEASVPEVDIAKIHSGDTATVSLDAFASDVLLKAEVTQIDPADTVVEGVPTYKVTLRFSENDESVKSGMTANVSIRTDEKKNVLVIPSRAVSVIEKVRSVRVLNASSTPTIVPVETGLRGSDGRIEILSGLVEGDKVVTFDPSVQ